MWSVAEQAGKGSNDFGRGLRIFYRGLSPEIRKTPGAINRFLDVMELASIVDRTNAVAATLMVVLRHNWPGHKPLICVTSAKSHGGKRVCSRPILASVSGATFFMSAGAGNTFIVAVLSSRLTLRMKSITDFDENTDVTGYFDFVKWLNNNGAIPNYMGISGFSAISYLKNNEKTEEQQRILDFLISPRSSG